MIGPEYLILPGYGGSGPGHWQSLWESGDPAFRRVQQRDWDQPDRGEWEARLDAAVAESALPKVLVAHSLACLLVVHWARGASADARSRVRGALLVAPVDPRSPAFPPEARGFGPVPQAALPFASLIVASSDDPYGTLEFSRIPLPHTSAASPLPIAAALSRCRGIAVLGPQSPTASACIRSPRFYFRIGGTRMQKRKLSPWLAAALCAGLAVTACGRKSEAEKTGDKIHQKVENVEDAVTNDGPAENAREAKEKVQDEVKDRSD